MVFTYIIRIEGQLDERWQEYLGVEEIAADEAEAGVSVLTCRVDQSGLHGILMRIRDLNLKLVEVRRED